MKTKCYLALLLGVVLLVLSATAFAEVEVEDGENLPPPMDVTYDAPATVVVTIPAYSPAPVETPGTPVTSATTPVSAIMPQPTAKPIAPSQDVKDDYKKGSVYGSYLSTRELKEVKAKVAEVVSASISDGMMDREKIIALVNYVPDLTGKDTFAVRITCGGTEPKHNAAATPAAWWRCSMPSALNHGTFMPQRTPHQPEPSMELGKAGRQVVSPRCADE